MEPGSGSPLTARAKFQFEGANNDELSFDKDDIITITQQQDGGWWEGTHKDVTGWFPSAYVTLITEKDKLQRSKSVPNATAREVVAIGSHPDYRTEVLTSYMNNETEYIRKLLKTLQGLLIPIGTAHVLSAPEYCTLVGNFEDIYSLQKSLLTDMETAQNEEPSKMRIGGVFMKAALELRTAMSLYAENHPNAVVVLNKKKKELEKISIEQESNFKELVVGLSEPLRHAERYQSLLQELERIVPANHPDRGDLQRGIAVYRETKDLCEAIRKQKESQIEFLYMSKCDKIVSPSDRGPILYVGGANVEFKKAEPMDRFVALFSKYIMFFEVTKEMTYEIKEKFPASGFVARRKDSDDVVLERSNTGEIILNFEAAGGEVERFFAAIGKAENVTIVSVAYTSVVRRPSKGAADGMNQSGLQTPDTPLTAKPPHPPGNTDILNLGKRKSSKTFDDAMNSSGLKFDHDLGMVLPDGFELPTSSRNSRNTSDNFQFSQFPSYFLSGNAGKRNERGFRLRKDAARDEEMEFDTLRILEGYCVETGGPLDHHGANDSYQQPHVIVAEDEKILVEEMIGDEVVLQEKSIVDAVYSMKDQLSFLQTELQRLGKVVEAEQKARRRLEHNLPKISGIISPDGLNTSTPRREINSFDS